jgi:hypothetical protein
MCLKLFKTILLLASYHYQRHQQGHNDIGHFMGCAVSCAANLVQQMLRTKQLSIKKATFYQTTATTATSLSTESNS